MKSFKLIKSGINIYYTLLNNYITRDYMEINQASTLYYDGEEGSSVANVNKGNAYILGSTASFKGNLNQKWFAKGSFTFTKGKTYDTNQPQSSIPPLFGMLGLGYEKDRIHADLNWKFNGKKKIEDYNLIEGKDNIEQTPFNSNTNSYYGSPGWNTFNFGLNYKLNNRFDFYLHIDNIFDVHYKEFASAISAAGRNFSISLLIK